MIELSLIALFLVVMLAPWVFFAQKISGSKIPFWAVLFAALLIGTALQFTFGANATYYIGYYGAIIFGLGLVAAAFSVRR